MRITFGCGHTADMGDNPSGSPVCACGDRRVTHVKARAPRFVGACTGPMAEFKNLGPATVSVAPGGSLALKPAKE